MTVSIDLTKAHLSRVHGDITVVFSWLNEERAMFLIPNLRSRAPWFIVMESASYSWDDSNPRNVSAVVQKSMKACDVLGIEPSPWNCRRLAGIIIDGLPDLIRMPHAPPKELHKASYGHLLLKEGGVALNSEDIKLEKQGVTYG